MYNHLHLQDTFVQLWLKTHLWPFKMMMKVLELTDKQNISEKETRFLGDAFFT